MLAHHHQLKMFLCASPAIAIFPVEKSEYIETWFGRLVKRLLGDVRVGSDSAKEFVPGGRSMVKVAFPGADPVS
jgi:hypothetical protein